MHRISDVRMGGGATKNFKMFRALCGDEALRNVILVTNMWGEVSQAVGQAREAELVGDDQFFKPVIDQGAQILRHDYTVESGQTILRRLLDKPILSLLIQRELVDDGKDLSQTAAGAQINLELTEQRRKHAADLEALQKDMQGSFTDISEISIHRESRRGNFGQGRGDKA